MQKEPAPTQEKGSPNEQLTCARWVISSHSILHLAVFINKDEYKSEFLCRLLQFLNPDPINPDLDSLDNHVSVGELCLIFILFVSLATAD